MESPVNLLSRRESRDHRLRKEMVFKIVEVVGVPEQEISKRETCPGDPRQRGETGLAGDAEIKRSARDVGLREVIPANFELKTQLILMAPPQHRHAGRDVVLRVAVLNKALPLGAHDVVCQVCYARRRWRAHLGGNDIVITRRPADLRQVKAGVLRAPVIAETANARVEAKHCCWSKAVRVPGGDGVTVIVLGAAVGAQAAS